MGCQYVGQYVGCVTAVAPPPPQPPPLPKPWHLARPPAEQQSPVEQAPPNRLTIFSRLYIASLGAVSLGAVRLSDTYLILTIVYSQVVWSPGYLQQLFSQRSELRCRLLLALASLSKRSFHLTADTFCSSTCRCQSTVYSSMLGSDAKEIKWHVVACQLISNRPPEQIKHKCELFHAWCGRITSAKCSAACRRSRPSLSRTRSPAATACCLSASHSRRAPCAP